MNEHSRRLLAGLVSQLESYCSRKIAASDLASAALSTANSLDEPSLGEMRIELEKFEAKIELMMTSVGEAEEGAKIQRVAENLRGAIIEKMNRLAGPG